MRDAALAVTLAGLLLLAGCNGTVGGEATATPDATVASTPTATPTATATATSTSTSTPAETAPDASVRFPACDRAVVFVTGTVETILAETASGESLSASDPGTGETTLRADANDTITTVILQTDAGSRTVENPTAAACQATPTPTATPTATPTPMATPTSTPTVTPTATPDPEQDVEFSYSQTQTASDDVIVDWTATNDGDRRLELTIEYFWQLGGQDDADQSETIIVTIRPGETLSGSEVNDPTDKPINGAGAQLIDVEYQP